MAELQRYPCPKKCKLSNLERGSVNEVVGSLKKKSVTSSCPIGENCSIETEKYIADRLYKEDPSSNPFHELSTIERASGKRKKTDSTSISDDEMCSDEFQTNENVKSDDVSKTDVTSKESQSLHADPALRQFEAIDELEEIDIDEGDSVESCLELSDSELSEELQIHDIELMLDEKLPDKFKSSGDKKCGEKLIRKVVLDEIGHDNLDSLPEGWIKAMHSCGMPIYLHRISRVCTMARPYSLGPDSLRHHTIPVSGIPCLHYKRASELEKKNKEKKLYDCQSKSGIELMSAEIQTIEANEENKAKQSLEGSELHEYCKKAFKFKTVSYVHLKSWQDKKKYIKMKRSIQNKQMPTLPEKRKYIRFFVKNPDGTDSKSQEKLSVNPNESCVCILEKYVTRALKRPYSYQFKELETPATPYLVTVFIGGMEYGSGKGISKKHAKHEAAKATLQVLIPGIVDKICPSNELGPHSGTNQSSNDTHISFLDQVLIEDPRVTEFSAKSLEPSPYNILLTCLGRNPQVGKIDLSYEKNSSENSKYLFTMSVGNHKCTVECRNKSEGKHRSAQAILRALHPNVTYWGSLLRMYGNRLNKDIKEKKQEEKNITQLQRNSSTNQISPNLAMINKLKTEILKLKDKRDAFKSEGSFLLQGNVILPSLSSTDLNKANLSSME